MAYGDLDRRFLADFARYLRQWNPHIRTYMTARERFLVSRDQERIVLTPQLRLVVEYGADRRRENLPTVDEVVSLIPYEEEAGPREIILAERSDGGGVGGWHRVHAAHAAYLPLAYPLMLPRGDYGFHWGLSLQDLRERGRARMNLTLRMYAAYILHPRPSQSAVPFAFGRLFQQLTVDLWASIEQTRLNWLRNNQSRIRADLYCQVSDWLQAGDGDAEQLGRRVILPAGHHGSDRFYYRCYQNSMAIVRAMRKPDFFITVTCNPNWPEIRRELLPGQTARDRPDIVGRVFQIKSASLIEELEKGVLGGCKAIVWTLEFQKRGLPHRHILLFLDAEARHHLRLTENIDRVVRAELPLPADDPDGLLRPIVESHMIHGPCGDWNPRAPCTETLGTGATRCVRGYPRTFSTETVVPEDGYPLYRRRDNGERVEEKVDGTSVWLDNRWVVPYNPYLSRRYNAHINIEVCSTVQAVKYIHKYIYKGSDRVTVNLTARNGGDESIDEIDVYLQCRYISPAEAIVRIFEFPIHEEWPAVIVLPVHLEGEQAVFFPEDAGEEEMQARMDRHTPLTAFFEYNRLHAESRDVLYVDFPSGYAFKQSSRQWVPRQRGTSIGRMLYVPPQTGERWYLRLLLSSIPGATSFLALRTVNSIAYSSFREACVALGLLEDDRHWIMCFEEAQGWRTGRSLRDLFILVLLNGDVSDPAALWDRFRHSLCDDLARRRPPGYQDPPSLAEPWCDYGLFLLDTALKDAGRTLSDFGLPAPEHDWIPSCENPLIQRELAYDRDQQAQIAEDMEAALNADQLRIFHEIIDSVATHPQQTRKCMD